MEQTEEKPKVKDALIVSEQIKEYVKETAKWGTFLAILGYISIGIIALISFVLMVVGSVSSSLHQNSVFGKHKSFFIIYLILAILYMFPTTFLYRFSDKAKDAIRFNDQNILTSTFKNLKSMFQFTGIMAIVIMSLYILILIFAIVFAAFFR